MPDLVLELFCEEIPARMQARAESDLEKALVSGLKDAGLAGESVVAQSGPRRLCVMIEGLPAGSADTAEERKGPKVGAPEQAVQGFLRGAGLNDVSEAEVRSDPKKGDFYVAIKKIPGRATPDILAELVPDIVQNFHWPKSMRSGRGSLRWVRPLQRIVCVFDGQTVPFEIDGLESGNETEGHRVHGRGPYTVTGPKDYTEQLSGPGHVMLTRDERRDHILSQAKAVCKKAGLDLVEDAGLLEEVVGLAEWPVVVLGDMDPAFLDLPPEVIQLSMRTHQKYFAVRDPKTGDIAPNFVVVANIEAADGGKQIAAGNSRVLSARLQDARFFWENDKTTGLDAMAAELGKLEFKKELGSMADKVERVAALAKELAPAVDADPDLAERAARLSKADLVSEMVYEFPELQGVMGRYYAQAAGEDPGVANAIADHYKPQGPSDSVPSEPVSIAVALADKLDTLVGFWAIDEKPTGSKDPFALRRAALGVVRLLLENGVRLAFDTLNVSEDLLAFFADRLKQYLRDKGQRHDLIDAVFALGEDDLVLIVKRVEALASFLETDDGTNLLAGYKRAANILKAEEKKGWTGGQAVDAQLISNGPKEEQALFTALTEAETKIGPALEAEDFAAAMTVLAGLRAPLDSFFDAVMVNAEDEGVRANRLALLEQVRDAVNRVADFSRVEG